MEHLAGRYLDESEPGFGGGTVEQNILTGTLRLNIAVRYRCGTTGHWVGAHQVVILRIRGVVMLHDETGE